MISKNVGVLGYYLSDSLSTSLGIRLTISLKAGVKLLGGLWGKGSVVFQY